MTRVHDTAIIEGDVELAADVSVGPHCVLSGPITVAGGTRLIGNVYLQGPLTVGRDNTVYPFACLGFAPQHAAFDPRHEGRGLVIGDGNTFREQVTIHRAFTDDGPTRIGDRNFFMATSHAGHDCQVGDDNTFVNGSALAGHVVVEAGVTVGGGTAVHQFCRVGQGAMLGGGCRLSRDMPPHFMLTGFNVCGSVNLVGLRRSNMSPDQIDDVRWVYRVLYRQGRTMEQALRVLMERRDSEIVAEYLRFLEQSERGICPGRVKAIRGMTPA